MCFLLVNFFFLPLITSDDSFYNLRLQNHHGRNGSCSITQLLSRPKISKSHCAISQEPSLYSLRTLSKWVASSGISLLSNCFPEIPLKTLPWLNIVKDPRRNVAQHKSPLVSLGGTRRVTCCHEAIKIPGAQTPAGIFPPK